MVKNPNHFFIYFYFLFFYFLELKYGTNVIFTIYLDFLNLSFFLNLDEKNCMYMGASTCKFYMKNYIFSCINNISNYSFS